MDNYSEDELRLIVNSSKSMAEVVSKLGYKTRNGENYKTVKKGWINTIYLQVILIFPKEKKELMLPCFVQIAQRHKQH